MVSKKSALNEYFLPAAVIFLVIMAAVYGNRSTTRYEKDVADVTAGLPAIFSALSYAQDGSHLRPAVAWSGSDARIVVHTRTSGTALGLTAWTRWQVVGQTPRGRFFQVEYELSRSSDCGDPLKCVKMSNFMELSPDVVKEMLYREGNCAVKHLASYKSSFC